MEMKAVISTCLTEIFLKKIIKTLTMHTCLLVRENLYIFSSGVNISLETFCAILAACIIGNIHVKLLLILASG